MWLDRLWQDTRHGLRLLGKSPGFTAIAVLSIACGTGANVAMFSVADTMLLRPMPVEDPGSLISVGAMQSDMVQDIAVASYPEFVDIRQRTTTLTRLVAFHSRRAGVAVAPAAPRQVRLVTAVSGNFFDDFRIPLTLGRGFLPEEDRVPGRNPVAVIDDDMWAQLFNRAADVVGRSLVIGTTAFTIVGVADESFTGVEGAVTRGTAYIPFAMWRELMNMGDVDPLTARDFRVLTIKARLRDDASLDQARAEIVAIGKDLGRMYPDAKNGIRTFWAQTEWEFKMSRGPVVARLILILSILALAVLGVACANVAGLLASRAPLRARELGLRLAVGAGRRRLVAQLLTESLAIALAGGVGGLAIGAVAVEGIQQLQFPTDVFALPTVTLNMRAMLFSVALATASALLFGLGPALTTTNIDLANALRVTDQGGRRRWRLAGRNTLVAVQVALSMTVLTFAGIAFQTFTEVFGKGPGFRTEGMAKIDIDASQAGYTGAASAAVFDRIAAAARELPGVRSAAVASAMPLWQFEVAPIKHDVDVAWSNGQWTAPPFANAVDEHYFETMDIRLQRGRNFLPTDTAGAPFVAIVNESMARRLWPGRQAVGERLPLVGMEQASVEIVGVVRDSVYLYPAEPPQLMMYLPFRQHPRGMMVLLAQTAGASAGPLPALRDLVRRIDPAIPTYDAQTIEQFYNAISVSIARMVLSMVSGIGIMGVTITVVGLYGLVSYAVNRRTREIGIRVAVGATYARVMRLLLRQGLTPAWVGLGAGILLSAGAAAWSPKFAPFTQTYDVWAVGALVPALFLVTLIAAFIPARRAATVNPVVALRDE